MHYPVGDRSIQVILRGRFPALFLDEKTIEFFNSIGTLQTLG
jgi:hypothetical protein